jgi:large-conductance mechanosensitive channel
MSVNKNILSNSAFFTELKKFISENNIIGTCAGVIIALVTKDLILAFVGDIVIPVFIILFLKLKIKWLTAILPSGKSTFDLTDFIKQLITWAITIFVTFLVIKATFQTLLGIELEKKEDEDDDKKNKKESFFIN